MKAANLIFCYFNTFFAFMQAFASNRIWIFHTAIAILCFWSWYYIKESDGTN